MIFLYPLILNAGQSQEIIFYNDDREHIVDLSQEECQVLLDNEQNFEFNFPEKKKLKITAKAFNTQSALLLVNCDQQTFVYSLSYKNHRKYETPDDFRPPEFKRPNSYVDSSSVMPVDHHAATSVQVVDQSYHPAGISASRSYPNTKRLDHKVDAVDLNHEFDDYSIRYGFSEATLNNGWRHTYRAQMGFGGYYFNTEHGKETDKLFERKYSLNLPNPLSLRIGYFQKKDQSIERDISRNFFGSVKAIQDRVFLVYKRTTFPQNELNFHRGEINNTLSIRASSSFNPELETAGACDSRYDICKANLMALRTQLKYLTLSITPEYAALPHYFALTNEYHFQKQQKLTVMYKRQYTPLPATVDKKWIELQDAEDGAVANSFLHLEYTQGVFYFSSDSNLPFYPVKTSRALQTSLGMRHEDEYTSKSLAMECQPLKSNPQIVFLASLRYYFHNNISKLQKSVATHTLSGKVLSEIEDQGIANADVSLITDEGRFSTQTDKNGYFKFYDIPKTGTFKLTVHSGDLSNEIEVTKTIDDIDLRTNLNLDDYVYVKLRFFKDSNKNKVLDKQDEQVMVENYHPMVDSGMITYPGSKYDGNFIWVPRKKHLQLVVQPVFLPVHYKLISVVPMELNTLTDQEYTVDILLMEQK